MPKRKPPRPLRPLVPPAKRPAGSSPTAGPVPRFLLNEFFLSALDRSFFTHNEFLQLLSTVGIPSHAHPLTRGEYILLRYAVCGVFPGAWARPRRLSQAFLHSERAHLRQYRNDARRVFRSMPLAEATEWDDEHGEVLPNVWEERYRCARPNLLGKGEKVRVLIGRGPEKIVRAEFLEYVGWDECRVKLLEGEEKPGGNCQGKQDYRGQEVQDGMVCIVKDSQVMDEEWVRGLRADKKAQLDASQAKELVEKQELDVDPSGDPVTVSPMDLASMEMVLDPTSSLSGNQAVEVSQGNGSVRFDVDVRLLAESVALLERKKEVLEQIKAANERAAKSDSTPRREELKEEVTKLADMLQEINRRLNVAVPGLRAAGEAKKGAEQKSQQQQQRQSQNLAPTKNSTAPKPCNGEKTDRKVGKPVNKDKVVDFADVEGSMALAKALVQSGLEKHHTHSRLSSVGVSVLTDVLECVGRCVATLLRARQTRNPKDILEVISEFQLESDANWEALESIKAAARMIKPPETMNGRKEGQDQLGKS